MIGLDEGWPWLRCPDGYRWVRIGSRDVLSPATANEEAYRPLKDHPALFREFTMTEPTKDGVLAFARRFGMLGVGEPVAYEQGPAWVERLKPWHDAIFAVRLCDTLWDAARHKEEATLAKHVVWRRREDESGAWDEVVVRSHADTAAAVAAGEPFDMLKLSPATDPELFVVGKFKSGELVRPALEFVRRKTTAALEGRPVVDPVVPGRSGETRPHSATVVGGVRAGLVWPNEDGGALRLAFTPRDLLGAIWLQLARAVAEDRRFRGCDACPKWFEVAGRKREDAKFCDDACRQKWHRQRVQQARTLKAEGMDLIRIANELGTDLSTVERWTKSKYRK